MTWLLVALGAAVGAVLRYAVAERFGGRFPWGILGANVAGSLALGVLTGAAAPADWQVLLGTGLCGAVTTYSAFGFDTVVLAEGRDRLVATLYVVATLVGGLGAALSGIAAGSLLGG